MSREDFEKALTDVEAHSAAYGSLDDDSPRQAEIWHEVEKARAAVLEMYDRATTHDFAGELSRTADELAFWKYQAIQHRAILLTRSERSVANAEKRAEKELEEARAKENSERYDAESSLEIGS